MARRRDLAKRVDKKRLPIAVSPVDGKVMPSVLKLIRERSADSSALFVYWANTVEMVVVRADFHEPFARNPAARGDVLQERHHIVGALRAPKGKKKDGIVAGHESEGSAGGLSVA